ncbi:heterokaryon incompatibility protein-domain-containing protein [Lasiosphaeria hispida]|uniref:Heterokaryon incompatibility protein-domain-containing protein n=1 Tax=Lasiosphaeria hispida TaxID=260671 RepID=A0AAJ0MIW7_9PEZI|nr:heterokaryon incompatibility protein-domain-containing protein [Lasiosphaeria hispida]
MASPIVYRPPRRSSGEIRLVRILAPNNLPDKAGNQPPSDLVHCQLEYVRLIYSELISPTGTATPLDWKDTSNDAPPAAFPEWRYTWGDFVALSYTWGDAAHTRDIVVDGCRVPVRSNLAALRALWEKQPVQQGVLIWIDALCINQGDVHERNEEVKRMRAIYKIARDVVVWLGEEEDDSQMAMKTIRVLANSCEDGTDQGLGDAPDMLGAGAWGLSASCHQAVLGPSVDHAGNRHGKQQTPVLCGDEVVRWGHIYHGISTFGTKQIDIFFSNTERECREAGVPYSGLNRNKLTHLWMEGNVQTGRSPPQFMPMLDLGRKSLATDLRDKVYGLMGLIPPEVAAMIEPDYDLSLSSVYISFATT